MVKRPPPGFGLLDLNGTWHDGYGGGFDMQVAPNGQIRGPGRSGDGTPLTLEGQIAGKRLSYTIRFMGDVVATGGGVWNGEQHLSFRTMDLNGALNLEGEFHVNHTNTISSCSF